jgi:Mg-chelatase subunit ChlD
MLDDNKFNDLRSALAIFISILEDSPVEERIGLASYSTSASEDLQLTTDLGAVNTTMANMPVFGFTNIGDGINKGASIMRQGSSREFVEKTMVVLTDGLQNVGPSAASAARNQVATGTIIHAITFGRDADQRAMRDVARIGKGSFFHASNGAQLKEVFEEIALTLNTIITE